MKHFIIIFSLILLTLTGFSQGTAQKDQSAQPQNPAPAQKQVFTSKINSGFYIKMGGAFPMGEFLNQHTFYDNYYGLVDTIRYNAAKFGGVFELGFLIYIGPAFANNHLRAGIDATFMAVSFNPTEQALPPNSSASKKYNYWYYFGGQKFGPVITINPIDYLMIDLSYKVNATASWYNNMWGMNLTNNEVSLGVRYRLMMFAFQYDWGKIKYTYNYNDNPKYWVDNSTFRILIGFKF